MRTTGRLQHRICAAWTRSPIRARAASILRPTDGPLSVIVVRLGQAVHGYINRCPHQGTPLETFPDRFLSRDGTELICTTHGARFRAVDGLCIRGPCKGQKLRPCSLEQRADAVFIDAMQPGGNV